MPSTRYLPIAGTWAWNDAWCMRDDSPFALMMAREGFAPLRAQDGRRFRWSTALDGLFGDDRHWLAGTDALYYFLQTVPLEHRNFIAHSHGGQLPLHLASQGVQIRSLITVGTPKRADVDSEAAAKNIGTWLHIYDLKRDWIQWLGQVGDKQLNAERSFRIPRVVNHPLTGIGHSKILRDERFLHYWTANGWLDVLRTPVAAV